MPEHSRIKILRATFHRIRDADPVLCLVIPSPRFDAACRFETYLDSFLFRFGGRGGKKG